MEIANISGWSLLSFECHKNESNLRVDQTKLYIRGMATVAGTVNEYDGVENSFLEPLNFVHLEKFNICDFLIPLISGQQR